MSDSEIRIQADKWECELMEEQLKQLQAERDEAVAESEGKNATINTLTRMYWELKRYSLQALEHVKKRRMRKSGKLLTALGITAGIAVLAWVGMATETLCASVGKPVLVICLAVASFLGGWIFQRESDNLQLHREVSKRRQQIESKGE